MAQCLLTALIASFCCSIFSVSTAPANESGRVWYEDGLRAESDDGRFTFRLSNRVQIRFTYNAPEDGENIGSFQLRRLKMKMDGRAFGDWKYKLQVNFAGQGDRTIEVGGEEEVVIGQHDLLEDAYFQYAKQQWIQPRIGQAKTFFGRERLTSSGKLKFVDRAIVDDQAEVDRDIGIGLVGHNRSKTIEYNAGVYNGNFLNQKKNDNTKFAYAGRVVWNPLGAFELTENALDYPERVVLAIGADGYYNTVTGDSSDLKVVIYGPEFALKIRGFSAQAEFYHIDLDLSSGGTGGINTGYVQAGYLLPNRKLEFAGRFAITDPSDEATSVSTQEEVYGIGVNYFFSGEDYKIQGDIRRILHPSEAMDDATEVRVQMQFVI